jgi:hypothetical protein
MCGRIVDVIGHYDVHGSHTGFKLEAQLLSDGCENGLTLGIKERRGVRQCRWSASSGSRYGHNSAERDMGHAERDSALW